MKEFKTFDHVLVRDNNNEIWRPALYIQKGNDKYPFHVMTLKDYADSERDDTYAQCIPFEGNEHLANEKDNLSPFEGINNGDMIAIKVRNSAIMDFVIFKEETEDERVMVYRYWNRNDPSPYRRFESFWAYRKDVLKVEKLSDESIEMFKDYMKKNGEIWNAENKQVEVLKWKPKKGETYWSIDLCCYGFEACSREYTGEAYQDTIWETGHMYQTQEEAEKVIEELKKVKF